MYPPSYPNSCTYPFTPPPPPFPFQYGSPTPPPAAGSTGGRIYMQNVIAPTIEPTHETEWSSSLFGCLAGDPDPCILAAICPCVVAGQIAEIVTQGKTCRICSMRGRNSTLSNPQHLVFLYVHIYMPHSIKNEGQRYMLKGTNFSDFMTHLNCMCCALCQEYRELYRLGFDPSIGWFENMRRDRNALAVYKITPPPVEEGMQR